MAGAIEISAQKSFWNEWNSANRELEISDVSIDQARVILRWLDALGRRDLTIIDVGCGTGWLSHRLARYGRVVATDLADEVVARAAERHPEVSFLAGDFMSLGLAPGSFDVVASCEVLSHVADQRAFVDRIASLLKPGGKLMLATQNRTTLEMNDIPPPGKGQLRHWVNRRELVGVLEPRFRVDEICTVTPRFNRGLLAVVNSNRSARIARRLRLGWAWRGVQRLEEQAGLGWTLMALATRR